MNIFVVAALVAVLAWALTLAFRRYALASSLLDIPNARSSHTVPTPRGGGVAIVLSFLLVLPLLAWWGDISWPLAWALLGGGGCVAVVGYLDDHGHIAARWRLLAHFAGAVWALFWLGGLPPVQVGGVVFDLNWLGHVAAAFYLVWLLNLYNFMDGIDGIAGVEVVTVCGAGALLYGLLGLPEMAVLPLLLAAASGGFLYWNFPPAKIFMGDAGSGFLGLALGILSLQAAWVAPQLLWSWLILLAVFIVDATWTLLRRLLRGDKVYEAHRSHAYQYASRRHGQHRLVTLAVLALNIGWLLPLAVWVAVGGLDGVAGFVLACVPLVWLAVRYDAGKQE
ncbi:MraY family glycosyltransferase [Pseudomonas turukhanskensis]|uniref:Glycosyl transferase n=1 Tax=Pseudomonas turukhanskensis TaxID=1806536 RepID=A0A9W6K755_9PSED|nr:glycosyltransferase family 4 protein [Pseudomonas turukhanskensis]GLK88940.1 glycosyl transferase [Pseudomonas turukhanskensis]